MNAIRWLKKETIGSWQRFWLDWRFMRGVKAGRVRPFDAETYEVLSRKVTSLGLPVDFYMKYMTPGPGMQGNCYERAMYLFHCFDDAILAHGEIATIACRCGWKEAGHGWIERAGLVYDPNDMCIYERAFYYEMERPRNVEYCTHAEYEARLGDDGYGKVWHWPQDFAKGGSSHEFLPIAAMLVDVLRRTRPDNGFVKDFRRYAEACGSSKVGNLTFVPGNYICGTLSLPIAKTPS